MSIKPEVASQRVENPKFKIDVKTLVGVLESLRTKHPAWERRFSAETEFYGGVNIVDEIASAISEEHGKSIPAPLKEYLKTELQKTIYAESQSDESRMWNDEDKLAKYIVRLISQFYLTGLKGKIARYSGITALQEALTRRKQAIFETELPALKSELSDLITALCKDLNATEIEIDPIVIHDGHRLKAHFSFIVRQGRDVRQYVNVYWDADKKTISCDNVAFNFEFLVGNKRREQSANWFRYSGVSRSRIQKYLFSKKS